ncbi:MAG: hypothetical protein KTR30_25325 [Saprospiraceae bacterium]|nr:hypothetical protein [Saprospiraceae bacterium]
MGHSAIPVQDKEQPYKANNPIPLQRDNLKLEIQDGWYNRGFEIMKLNGSGNSAEVTYYQVAGVDPLPIEIYKENIT